jgi:hypothetical protein
MIWRWICFCRKEKILPSIKKCVIRQPVPQIGQSKIMNFRCDTESNQKRNLKTDTNLINIFALVYSGANGLQRSLCTSYWRLLLFKNAINYSPLLSSGCSFRQIHTQNSANFSECSAGNQIHINFNFVALLAFHQALRAQLLELN